MKITAAVTEEQGQTFVVVLVKHHVIDNPSARQEMLAAAQETFGVRAALLGERLHRAVAVAGVHDHPSGLTGAWRHT